jgi:hypothetical protein
LTGLTDSGDEARSTNWEALARYGQVMERILLAALPPAEIRRLRGPAVKRSEGDNHPLFDPSLPLRILLGPDLDSNDAAVRHLALLNRLPHVQVYADRNLSMRLSPITVEPWSVERTKYALVATLGSGLDREEIGIGLAQFSDLGLAAHLLGEDYQRLPGDVLQHYSDAIHLQLAYRGPTHMMATRASGAVLERCTHSGLATAGFFSPEETLLCALLIQHHHGRHITDAAPSFTSTAQSFSWYSGAAQLAMPKYLPLFTRVVRKLQGQGRTQGLLFECFEGLFKRVRQLLRVHDELGWLQIAESYKGANNGWVEKQSDLVFEAVSAVQSVLDAFTVMLVTKSGNSLSAKAMRWVSFRALNNGIDEWTDKFGRYQPVADIAREPMPLTLEMALDLRRVGFHYRPLLGVTLSFNEWIQGVNPDGSSRVVSVREDTAGAILLGDARPDGAVLVWGVDGLLPFSHELYALPWGFVRGLIRDTLTLLNRLLDSIAAIDGVAEKVEEGYFGPSSPYASFMLQFDRQLALGVPKSLGYPGNVEVESVETPAPE